MNIEAPDACTLPTAQQPVRLGEIKALLASSVESLSRLEAGLLRLTLTADAAVAARTADLLVRESGCCSFFTFTLTITDGRLTLDVAVPPAHGQVLDGMAGWAGW
ncbi:MAG: hypothetical protein ABJA34_05440 [Pseudonocardiales bacterium]